MCFNSNEAHFKSGREMHVKITALRNKFILNV